MRLPLFPCLLAVTLVACSQADGPDDGDAAPADGGDTASEIDAPPAPQTESDEDRPGEGPAPEAEDAAGYSSRYTKLDLDSCEVLDQSDGEGSWINFRCRGLDGIPLFVSEGDGRFDLDAGTENENFATIGAFNDISETLEWRMRHGEPFAVIFRFRDVSLESGPRSVLAIERIGTRARPGCRVAQIAGDTPRANQRARQIADTKAAGFDCSQEPQFIGDAR